MNDNDQYKELHYLTGNELNQLLESLKPLKHKCIVLLMGDCGLRVSEVISLKIKDFDFKKKLVYVKSLKKRDKEQIRKIPLSDRLYRIIADYIYTFKDVQPDSFLFPNAKNDGHIQRFAVNRFLDRAKLKKNYNTKLHPHTLRHTFATSLIAQKVPLHNVKLMLGHQKYDTTLIYTHIPEEELRNNIASITTNKESLFQKFYNRLFASPVKYINIRNGNTFVIGRNQELQKINELIINTLSFLKFHASKFLKCE